MATPLLDPQAPLDDADGWADGFAAGRRGAVFLQLQGRPLMQIKGPDTADYLHRLLTWAVKDMAPGDATAPFLLSTTGRVELSFGLLRLEDDAFWLDLPPGGYQKAFELLERFHFSEDLAFSDISEAVALVSVQGPEAGAALARLGLPTPDAGHQAGRFEDQPLRVARRDRIAGPGYDLWIQGDVGPVLQGLREAGAVEIGGRALHALRVTGGVPQYGAEYTDKSSPLEISEMTGITDGKGCYPGQEVIEMTIARGRPPRALRGVDLAGPAEAGDSLLVDGKDAGALTSVTPLPGGSWAGLALVRRRHLDAEGVQCGGQPAVLRSPLIAAMKDL